MPADSDHGILTFRKACLLLNIAGKAAKAVDLT
jgi:hypothetical protein